MKRTDFFNYQLLIPIEIDGKIQTEINLRHLKLKDLKAMEGKDGIEQITEMIASLSGWSYRAIYELCPCDFLNIKEILEPLITKPLEMIKKFQENIKAILKSFSIKIPSLENFKELTTKINNINMSFKMISAACIFIHNTSENKNKFYTDTFEKNHTTTINEKAEIYRNYEPITAHNPYSINNEITLIGCNIFLQNNPLNQPPIASNQKPEYETKKTFLEKTFKLLDIILKFLNLPSWFLEFLLQGFKNFFKRYF
ncbi:phage tail assembly protein [Bartonella senegalensis]|uniref:phage tail assembly protein n=1 Tax=Bartonella senegalensis TaxID=1468418 RepID=UPI0002FC7B11|nr:phage tail assembly protein [Bartonella senegalensis]